MDRYLTSCYYPTIDYSTPKRVRTGPRYLALSLDRYSNGVLAQVLMPTATFLCPALSCVHSFPWFGSASFFSRVQLRLGF